MKKIFRQCYRALHAFLRNIDLNAKNQKIECSFSVFPVFVCGPFIPLVSTLGQSGQHSKKINELNRLKCCKFRSSLATLELQKYVVGKMARGKYLGAQRAPCL